jgi:hypothetical protein
VPRLLIEVSEEDLADPALLASWRWLIGDDKSAIAVSASGDVFLKDQAGIVHWLDCGAATVKPIAKSEAEFESFATDPAKAEYYFMVSHVESLEAAGIPLASGECYSFLQLPIVGGKYEAANRFAIDYKQHVGFSGWFNDQIKDYPDGTKVKTKIVP